MTNDNTKNLLPCPFCGKKETLKVTSASEFWDDCEGAPYMHSESYGVFCDASKPGGPGGCGASSGFKETVQQAIETWNTRENKQSGCATWHEAIQEEFDLLHTPMPFDPRDAIKRLIQLETAIALDPDVSEQANALVQRGRSHGLKEAVDSCINVAHKQSTLGRAFAASDCVRSIEQLKGIS